MSRAARFVRPVAFVVLGFLPGGESWGQTAAGRSDLVAHAVAVTSGRIQGTVRDVSGAPLGGAMVSVLGPTMAFAVTDADGRYELSGLPPGPYLLRAHLKGFAVSAREIVEVTPSGQTRQAFALRRLGAAHRIANVPSLRERPISILAAGLASAAPESAAEATEGDEPDPAATSYEPADATPHDHSETAWRLRHAKRSVLKDTTSHVAAVAADAPSDPELLPGAVSFIGRAVGSSARFAATLFDDGALSGQLNLLTSSAFDRPTDLFSRDRLPRGVAYLTVGAPAGSHGGWSVRGALTDGDVASWIVAGSYARHAPARHAIDVGLTYGRQQYEGGNPAALAALSADRNVGAVHAYDTWALSRVVAINYGARYAWYDYLDRPGLFSPKVGVNVAPWARTRVRATVAQRMLAPGAEEFLPPASASVWLPPERTFSPLDANASFQVERNRQFEVALDREIADEYVIGVRRYYEAVENQLVTVFGISSGGDSRSDLGHYFMASVGNIEADGWGVTLSRPLAPRIRGSVDYSVTSARWHSSSEAALVEKWAPSAVRETERFHDITTAVETDIPVTATRVFVVYRINTAYTRETIKEAAPGLDARFDVQIKQGLPFLPFGSQWEMLLAVRNLFREALDHRAAYDELLVVRPPKRIVGGLLVRF